MMIINVLCITSIVLNVMTICFYGFLIMSSYKKSKLQKKQNPNIKKR